jgi:hypothetical protein
MCRYETNGSSLIAPELRESRTHLPKKEILQVADYRMRHNQYSKPLKRISHMCPACLDTDQILTCQDADLIVSCGHHAL